MNNKKSILHVENSIQTNFTVVEYKWKVAPTGDFYDLTIMLREAPNAFHRFMQRMVLGIKYQKVCTQSLDETDKSK